MEGSLLASSVQLFLFDLECHQSDFIHSGWTSLLVCARTQNILRLQQEANGGINSQRPNFGDESPTPSGHANKK